MKLSEYIQRLEEIRKRHGDDLEIVYASDDEGNRFDEVRVLPVVGKYVGDEFCAGEFGGNIEIDHNKSDSMSFYSRSDMPCVPI